MKKIFVLVLFLSAFHTVFSQKKIILEMKEVTGYENNSIVKGLSYKDSIKVYDITYLSDGLKVKGYIVRPAKQGKYPAIIYNRGGNRDFGAWTVPFAYYELGRLAKEGYIVAASQYRGNGGGEGAEEFGGDDVNDVLNLIDALPEIEGVDVTKIGMYGWSRGGMMTYLALARTKKIKAAVVGGGLSDLKASLERLEMEFVYEELIPDYKKYKNKELSRRSVINWVSQLPKDVPILLLHGNADWRVKPEQTLKLALEFEKHRIPYRLIMFEGSDHGISERKDDVDAQVFDWFKRYVKDNEPLPDMNYHGR
jgi:dipeptidyl aminopeptidase/acylaminoacyl peptidase